MTVLSMLVFDSAQVTAVEALNNNIADVIPRAVDGASPGAGINLNTQCPAIPPGTVIDFVGKAMANARLVNDPWYIAQNPNIVTYCVDNIPICQIDSDIVFAPQPSI